MNFRVYLFSIIVGFVLSLGVWILILLNIDPYKADFISISAFYLSMLAWIACLLSTIIYYLKVGFGNKEILYSNLPTSFRQGILVSLAISGLLFFQSIQVLTWWIAGIWVMIMLITELFFKTRNV